MMTANTKTTTMAYSLSSPTTTNTAKPVVEELDSHRAAAFLLLQVKEMATDELVSAAASKQEQRNRNHKDKPKKKKTKKTPTTAKTIDEVVMSTTTTAPSVSLPCSPLLFSATPRPLPQKPQLPRSTSAANFLLPPPQVVTNIAGTTWTTLMANVDSQQAATPARSLQGWLLPCRRTVSLGSSSENLPGLLLKAMKQEQAKTLAAGSESPSTTAEMMMMMNGDSMTSSISSLSTSSSYESSLLSSSTWSSLSSSSSPALVSPTADRPASDLTNNETTSAMMLPMIPIEMAAATAAVKLMLDNQDCSDKNSTMTTADGDDANGATTLPLAAATAGTTTAAAHSGTTTDTIVLRRKFSWKTHPVLEQYLLDHRCEYLAYSAKLNYTAEQKRYNNTLTTNLIALAVENGLVFCPEHFTFAAIRDRIRCFYKSHVQAAKKKKRKQQQQQQASSSSNSSNSSPASSSPSLKRKKIKMSKTTSTALVTDTVIPSTLMGQLEEEEEDDNDHGHPVDHLEIMAE